MSDTIRKATPGWGPGHPFFDRVFGSRTKKWQERDNKGFTAFRRTHRFTKGLKNSKHNLGRKIDELRLDEAMDEGVRS